MRDWVKIALRKGEAAMQTLDEIIRDACADLRDCDIEDVTEPHDIIHEIADGSVPIYTSDLLELASQNIGLATVTPELGPAFDGEPTPVNIIAANVYEAVTEGLWEEWREIEEERELADSDCSGSATCVDHPENA